MSHRFVVIAAIALCASLLFASRPTGAASGPANYLIVIEFSAMRYLAPSDWSCKAKKDCIECVNVATESSRLFVVWSTNSTFYIPPGEKVQSCGNVLFVPGNAEEPVA